MIPHSPAERLHIFTITVLMLFISGAGCACIVSAAEITDHDGIVHRFDQPFQRIISLYPAHTENLVEMGAANVLIGISSNDSEQGVISDKKRFSYHDTAEKFIAAAPDCVLIRPMIRHSTPNLIKKLEQYGVTVISFQPTSPSTLYSYWEMLGLLSGYQGEALEMTNRFQAELAKLSSMISLVPEERRPRVYFESIHSRMKTFSPDSIAVFCLTSAGGLNVADDATARRNTNIAAYGKERIIARSESIDVFLAQFGRMNRITREEIINEPGFGAIKAIRENRVYLVAENLVSRPTTRLIEGMFQINRLLYQDSPL